jgi:hypothetical protein
MWVIWPTVTRNRWLAAALSLVAVFSLTALVVTRIDAKPEPAPAPTAPLAVSSTPPAVPTSAAASNVLVTEQVAPLRRVVPPDLLAVVASGVKADQVARIRKLKKVRDVIVVDGGGVTLQGRQINLLAVDPSEFRSWTSPVTARKQALWAALAADKLVVSSATAKSLSLRKGTEYPIIARSSPQVALGGIADLGIPGVDALVGRRTGAELGLISHVALMVNAPGADPATLVTAVKGLLDPQANVINLHGQAAAQQGQATGYLDLYKRAATTCPGLPWTVLAAIGQVESDHGRNAGQSSAGALGPMQFLPSTWKAYGVDGDGDGKADITNPFDAIPGAAKYLCASGGGKGGDSLYKAIFAYNHADWYVQKVLNLAAAYARQYS